MTGIGGSPTSRSDRTAGRAGRPRDDVAEQAILEAVVALLGEQGYAGTTIAAVAARAGVGKPTVYRRWSSKSELVVDAVVRLAPPITARRSGDPHTDIRRLTYSAITEMTSQPMAGTLVTLLTDMQQHPALPSLVQERLVRPRRAVIGEIIEQAVNDGGLGPATDPELMLDLLLGPLLYRWLTAGEAPTRASVNRLVDSVWDFFAP